MQHTLPQDPSVRIKKSQHKHTLPPRWKFWNKLWPTYNTLKISLLLRWCRWQYPFCHNSPRSSPEPNQQVTGYLSFWDCTQKPKRLAESPSLGIWTLARYETPRLFHLTRNSWQSLHLQLKILLGISDVEIPIIASADLLQLHLAHAVSGSVHPLSFCSYDAPTTASSRASDDPFFPPYSRSKITILPSQQTTT